MKYEQAVIDSQYKEIIELLDQGYTRSEIGKKFGISLDDLEYDAEKYPEFATGLEEMANKHTVMTRSLIWKLAQGYEYEEKTVTERVLPSGEVEKVTTTVTRVVPPNLEACKEILRLIKDAPLFARAREKKKEILNATVHAEQKNYASTRHKSPRLKHGAC